MALPWTSWRQAPSQRPPWPARSRSRGAAAVCSHLPGRAARDGNPRSLAAVVSCLLLVMPIFSFLILQIQVSWFCFVSTISKASLSLSLPSSSNKSQMDLRHTHPNSAIAPLKRSAGFSVQDRAQVPECAGQPDSHRPCRPASCGTSEPPGSHSQGARLFPAAVSSCAFLLTPGRMMPCSLLRQPPPPAPSSPQHLITQDSAAGTGEGEDSASGLGSW